jgi:hypothetical protein
MISTISDDRLTFDILYGLSVGLGLGANGSGSTIARSGMSRGCDE